MILYPTQDMTVIEWADQMAFFIGSVTPYERLDDPEKWQDWAAKYIGEPTELGQEMPNPYQFDDWREWAERLFYTIDFEG